MKLNLGCGRDYREGFINIDARQEIPLPGAGAIKPDMVTDITANKGMLYPPNSISKILARDILEHFVREEGAKLLDAWVAMLEPHGELELQFPDIESCVDRAKSGQWTWFQAIHRIYGAQDYKYNFHYWAYSESMIQEELAKRGMKVFAVEQINGNLHVKARKE